MKTTQGLSLLGLVQIGRIVSEKKIIMIFTLNMTYLHNQLESTIVQNWPLNKNEYLLRNSKKGDFGQIKNFLSPVTAAILDRIQSNWYIRMRNTQELFMSSFIHISRIVSEKKIYFYFSKHHNSWIKR